MSILHIFNVTDSGWKKSHWATSSICLCHSISSTAAFSQMMRKLLSQLQHPLFFFFFPLPILFWSCHGPVPAFPQPNDSEVPVPGTAEPSPLLAPKAGPTLPSPGPAPRCSFPAGSRSRGWDMRECHEKPSCSSSSSSGAAQPPGLTGLVTGAALRGVTGHSSSASRRGMMRF